MLLVYLFLVASILVMLIAAAGLLRLPNALARQHAATKAATLSISPFLVGLALHALISGWGWEWLIRIIALLAVLLITLPLAAHALGRSAVIEQGNDLGESRAD